MNEDGWAFPEWYPSDGDLTAYLEAGPWKDMNLSSIDPVMTYIEKFETPNWTKTRSPKPSTLSRRRNGFTAYLSIADEISGWYERGPLNLDRLENDPEYRELIRDLIILELDVKDYLWWALNQEVEKQLLWGDGFGWNPRGII